MRRAIGPVALALVALWPAACRDEASDAPLVDVERGRFEKVLAVRGKLAAMDTLTVSAGTHGKLSFMVPEGTLVKKDDPLFSLETAEIEQELQTALLDLAVAEANAAKADEEARSDAVKSELSEKEKLSQLEFAQLKLTEAREDLEKKQRQVKNQILTRSELSAAELGVQQAELSLASAEIDLRRHREETASKRQTLAFDRKSAQAQLEKVRSQVAERREYLEKSTARAARDGIAVHVEGWRGDTWKVGDEVWRNTPIMELPDLSAMEVQAEVNEVDIASVAVGTPARIRVEAFPDLRLTGKVREISGLATDVKDEDGRATGIHVFQVKIALDAQDSRLRPGLSAHCELVLEAREQALLLPAGAVRRDGKAAYVISPSGRHVPVEVAAASADEVAIASGLEEGDQVRMSPQEEETPSAAGGEPEPEAVDEAAVPEADTDGAAPVVGAASGQ